MLTKFIQAPTILAAALERWSAAPPPSRGLSYVPVNNGWDKLRYTKLVDETRERFPIGSLVAYRAANPREGQVPLYYKVTYIEEVLPHATWDAVCNQPECLTAEYDSHLGTTTIRFAPSRLRPLTEGELALVNLSNKPVQGTA